MKPQPYKPDRDRRREALRLQPDSKLRKGMNAGENECGADREPTGPERRVADHEARAAGMLAGATGRRRIQPAAVKASLSEAAKATRAAQAATERVRKVRKDAKSDYTTGTPQERTCTP